MIAQLRRNMLIAGLLGLIVMLALGLFSDIRTVGSSFQNFNWLMLPAVLGFTMLNYALRWLKWEYYLRSTGMGHGVSVYQSILLFTSGMVMAVTPGKAGEVLKSYLLKRLNGTPITASAPIVLAERLTDRLAMLLLMGFGLTLYPPARPLFVLLVVLAIIGLVVLQFRPLCEWLINLTRRLPRGVAIAPHLQTIYDSTTHLLSWRLLVISTIISLVSWFGECVAMYYVLRGLGQPDSLYLLQVATFVFAASTLFGLVSFLPGGLGVSEASSTGMLVLLLPISTGAATAATIIIRFCTLWFGVSLGAVALGLFGIQRDEQVAEPLAEEVTVSSST